MLNIAGLVVLILFYIAVLAVGLLASRWFKKGTQPDDDGTEMSIVAGRKLGGVVGVFTMTGEYRMQMFWLGITLEHSL